MEKDDLMSKKDVMEYLKISHQTLFRLMKSYAFPYIKLERRVLFRRSEIDKFLESKTVRKG
jgi:excisionase family DNA binding protein